MSYLGYWERRRRRLVEIGTAIVTTQLSMIVYFAVAVAHEPVPMTRAVYALMAACLGFDVCRNLEARADMAKP